MIKTLQTGSYRLQETKGHVKILNLDGQDYAWVAAEGIGEVLVTSHVPHKMDHMLATGSYNIYDVTDEPKLSDQQHMELEVDRQLWQGYLLLTGLPNDSKKRSRIIPTREIITAAPSPS